MRRTLKNLVLILTVSFVLIGSGVAANAILPALAYFVVGQMLSDAREAPIEHNTVALNPIYNTMWDSNLIGSNPDPRTIVAANCRGTVLVFEPGQMSRKDIVGFEMTSNSSSFPRKIAMFWRPKAKDDQRDWFELARKSGLDIEPCDAFTTETPRMAKWQLPVDTTNLPHGLYQVTVRVFFIEQKASGIFRTGRKDVIQRDETLCRFVVLDPAYMETAVNSPEIQASLRASFGLMGGPPQIGGLNIAVSPDMAKNLPQPGIVQPNPIAPAAMPNPPVQPALQPQQPDVSNSVLPHCDGSTESGSEASSSASATRSTSTYQIDGRVDVAQSDQAPLASKYCKEVAVWLGSTKWIWHDQLKINAEDYEVGQKINFWRGGSLVVKLVNGHVCKTWQGGTLVARATVTQARQDYLEIRITAGHLPAGEDKIFPEEEVR